MTLFGWDASHYDWDRGPMNLAAAKSDGMVFFTHKSSEGNSYRDDRFAAAMGRAVDAGFAYIGAYHVVRSSSSVQSQVDFFARVLDDGFPGWRTFGGFFAQCDLELWDYDRVPASIGEQWADLVETQLGIRVLMYASKGQYGDNLTGTSHPLWNANYGNNNAGHYRAIYDQRGGDGCSGWTTYSGKMPDLLQYGSRTTIGAQGTCDANAFRGTEAQFAALIGSSATLGAVNVEDVDMGMLVRDNATGQLYACFGFRSYPVKEERLADIKYVAGQGAYTLAQRPAGGGNDVEWDESGWIRQSWKADVWGPVDTGGATMTDEQIDAIARQIADQLTESGVLSYDSAVAAAKQALREGSHAGE